MVNVAWVVLHCNRRIGARERRQLIPHVRFQVPFLGSESQWKSGFACAGLLCIFLQGGNIAQFADRQMTDQLIRVHCSELGGGIVVIKNGTSSSQQKVYGPSLAIVDDWKRKMTQLGRTKSTPEYAVYQLLASIYGWKAWVKFLPEFWTSAPLLLTRAVRLLQVVTIVLHTPARYTPLDHSLAPSTLFC